MADLLFSHFYGRNSDNDANKKDISNTLRFIKSERIKKLLLKGSTAVSSINQIIYIIIVGAFIDVVLLVAYFVVLYIMSQGRDIVIGMFEHNSFYGWKRYMFTILTTAHYAVCMWIIPAFLYAYQNFTKGRLGTNGKYDSRSSFNRHYFFVHRFLSMIPFWGMALMVHHDLTHILIIVGIITPFFFLSWMEANKTILWICVGIVGIILILAFCHYCKIPIFDYHSAKFTFSFSLIVLSYIFYYFFYKQDKAIIHEATLFSKMTQLQRFPLAYSFARFRFNTIAYVVILLINIVGMYLLVQKVDYRRLAPESILLFVFAFYVFLFDFIAHVLRISIFFKFLALIVFGWIIFTIVKRHLDYSAYEVEYIKTDTSSPHNYQLQPLRNHLDKYTQRLKQQYPGMSHIPLILVSGEGGGSRAGLWFSQMLMNMEVQTKGKFSDFIFGMSTVSGSTIGAEAMIAYWKYKGQLNSQSPNPKYPAMVFRNNFISGGIFSLLTTDWWRSMRLISEDYHNRNSVLFHQEAYAIHAALYNSINPPDNSFFALKANNQTTSYNDIDYCMNDFMDFYYDSLGNIKDSVPILFSNTCRSGDGKRGIVSPICLDSAHIQALDIGSYIYGKKTDRLGKLNCKDEHISLAAACNISELFPFFSAPAYVGDLGYFVDGGYHENSGLKTTAELYEQIKQYLGTDTTFDIYVIYLKNGEHNDEIYDDSFKPNAPFFQPINAITNVPFSGHANYFEKKFKNLMKGTNHYIEVFLNYKSEDSTLPILQIIGSDLVTTKKDKQGKKHSTFNFPLARLLSQSVITLICEKAQQEMSDNLSLKSLLRTISDTKQQPQSGKVLSLLNTHSKN